MSYVNYNGKLVESGSALTGSQNRGLRYGDGLFETMKIIGGNIQFLQDHLDRLWLGLNVLGFTIPPHFTKKKIHQEVISLCEKNKHQRAGRIRINIIRGDGGLYDAENHQPNFIIESWELSPTYNEFNSNGLVVAIYPEARKACDILANLKHNNYLPYVLGALYAKNKKCNDALVLNSMGRICDSTIANIFMVKDEQVITPGLPEGCVAGVMRKNLIRHLADNQWTVIEQPITIEDLLAADEVFLTNSMFVIRWVQQIQERSFSSVLTQKIYNSFLPTIS